MTFQFRPAKRENVPLLIGVAGGTGSGKTYSALSIARGLAGDEPFALIDTESGRAKHYADSFQPWHHGDLSAPFGPDRYAEAITAADTEGYPVIVVDSFSHEHAGDGGLLDMHEDELRRMAGDDYKRREAMTFAAWVKPKMAHKALVSKLLQLRAHLVIALRAEEKIEIVKEDGKTKVIPKRSLVGAEGWVPIAEKSLPYELTASFLLLASAPGVPKPIKLPDQFRSFVPLNEPLSVEVGRRLAEWARGGAEEGGDAPSDDDLAELRARLLAAVPEDRREDIAAIAEAHSAEHDEAEHRAWLKRQIARAQEKPAEGASRG